MRSRLEQKSRFEAETLAEMRAEYSQKQRQMQNAMSRSPMKLDNVKSEGELKNASNAGGNGAVQINEEDFQKWLKQQETFGNGLTSRVAEKMSKTRPKQAAAQQPPINTDLENAGTPAKLIN